MFLVHKLIVNSLQISIPRLIPPHQQTNFNHQKLNWFLRRWTSSTFASMKAEKTLFCTSQAVPEDQFHLMLNCVNRIWSRVDGNSSEFIWSFAVAWSIDWRGNFYWKKEIETSGKGQRREICIELTWERVRMT